MNPVTPSTIQPTVLDRAIAWLSPERGARRLAWRTIEASYKGGVPTRTSESYDRAMGYTYGTAADRFNLMSARDRAYQSYRDNSVARTLVQTETDNVIGDGLNFQATTSSEEFNREYEDRYWEWSDKCDLSGKRSGVEVQRTIWDRSRVAGDFGWILVARGPESYIQLVPAENIVNPTGGFTDPSVVDGIRFGSRGEYQVFYVRTWDERGIPTEPVPVFARDFVFFPHLAEPNQARGETAFITIFDLLSHLDRYIDGVSLAAWMATVFGIIFKQTNSAKEMRGLGTLLNSQGVQQKSVTFENGMVKYVGADDEVAQVQAQQPMQQTPEFIRTMMRQIGAPFDMPLEVLAKDMSTVNFASARIGLLGFYRSCRIKQARFISRWSRTVRWWISREANRAPDDPKRFKTAFPPDYWNHEFLGNEWDYTDPVSEAQSDLLQIDMGTKSVQQVIAERGRNAALLLKQREEWSDKTKDLPQVRSTMTRDAAPEKTQADQPISANRFAEQSGGNGNGNYDNQ